MLAEARARHTDSRIRWLQDRLPGLEATFRLGLSFDLIMLSAVWMHIAPDERSRAFRKLVSLLKPGGSLVISLRHGGSTNDARTFHEVSVQEVETLARQYGIAVKRIAQSSDQLARADVRWEVVWLQLPDDGTGALPLLRHTIFNDSKSSTYKLALLRVLVRIADGAVGAVREVDDECIAVPLGLVALYWVRMYKPLIERQIAQKPASKDNKGLGFVKEPFRQIAPLSPYDLRVGGRFDETMGVQLRQAMIDVRETVHNMPAHYIKYPNSSDQIFKTTIGRVSPSKRLILDTEFFRSFGELTVPRHLWQAMTRYASWIEPALIHEWIRLMQQYEASNGRNVSYDELMKALTWLDPERDTVRVRNIARDQLVAGNQIYCAWSGKALAVTNLDIDHCFPFSAWPCGDLWNLLPCDRRINQASKSDKLVTPATLAQARDRLIEWWESAYLDSQNNYLSEQFNSEVRISLPLVSTKPSIPTDDVFDAVMFKRAALKQDLQLADWEFRVK
jgi:SAM-dependent methyltransferase